MSHSGADTAVASAFVVVHALLSDSDWICDFGKSEQTLDEAIEP